MGSQVIRQPDTKVARGLACSTHEPGDVDAVILARSSQTCLEYHLPINLYCYLGKIYDFAQLCHESSL